MVDDQKTSPLDTQAPLADRFNSTQANSFANDLKQTMEAWRNCPDKDRAQFIEKLIGKPETNPDARAANVAFIKIAVAEGIGKGLSSLDPSLQDNMLKYLKDNEAPPKELTATPAPAAAPRPSTQP